MTHEDPEAKKYTGPPEDADASDNGMPQTAGAADYEKGQLRRIKPESEMQGGEDHEFTVREVRRRTPSNGSVD